MTFEFILLAFILFAVIATLYSTVGHAGASGYLAIMGLLSFAPESIKTTSLILNSVVAAIASYKFISNGYFDKRIFIAVIITSVPAAFIAGSLHLKPDYFKLCAGIFLVLSSVALLTKGFIKQTENQTTKKIPWAAGLSIGGVIGFFSGLIGVGGGIFLSPIMVLLKWTDIKKVSGISALFIFFNSISGLMGNYKSIYKLDYTILYWLLAVVIGGIVGSYLGTKKFNNKIILGFLFVVLLSAGIKFVVGFFSI